MSSDNDIFPDVVRIEASGLCNFKCIHCPTGIQPNGRQVLDEKKFSIIMEQFIANNFIPRVVVLYHGGEPLLNKYLGQYIRLLKNMGVAKTVITTNSSLLSKEKAAELILAGLDELKVSFDGESANENNSIRKNGDFYSNADNVKSLCKIRKILGRKNPTIIIYNTRICDKITLNTLNKSRRFIFQEAPQYIT
ncbi:MAG: radical SAM protein, partial [Anaerolineae bacterium]|nr:radical SAM protein [Anaerolineae bacterium]